MTNRVNGPTPISTAMPPLDPRLDCDTTQSSSCWFSLLARPLLLADTLQVPTQHTDTSTYNSASARLVSNRPTSRQQVQPEIRTYQIKPTPTILHYCFATALYYFFDTSAPYRPATLPATATTTHPPGITMSFPRLSDPAISAAGLGLSVPQPLPKFDPGPTTHPSDKPPNIMRDTSTPILPFPKL